MSSEPSKYYKLCDYKGQTKGEFQLQKGLIEDSNPLSESEDCNGLGLYFTTFEHVMEWSDILNYMFCFEVEIPEEEKVISCNSGKKFKSKRLNIISDMKFIFKLEEWKEFEKCKKHIKDKPEILKFININEEFYKKVLKEGINIR